MVVAARGRQLCEMGAGKGQNGAEMNKDELREIACDDCKLGNKVYADPYGLPKIRCECGYVGPAHGQKPINGDLYCKHCGCWYDKSAGITIPESEWRIPYC